MNADGADVRIHHLLYRKMALAVTLIIEKPTNKRFPNIESTYIVLEGIYRDCEKPNSLL